METLLNCPHCHKELSEVTAKENPFRTEVRYCDDCNKYYPVANLIGITTFERAKEVLKP